MYQIRQATKEGYILCRRGGDRGFIVSHITNAKREGHKDGRM